MKPFNNKESGLAKKIARFAASEVHNQPHLITASGLADICAYIEKRNNGFAWKQETEKLAVEAQKQMGWDKDGNWCCYEVENGIAIINISGALTTKPTMFQALCGGCSYEDLTNAAAKISEDPSISTVVLQIDSGGGQAYRVFEAAQYIKDKLSSKKLITYVDGMMASAAYALGCISDEVIMNPDAQTGSIGVVVHLEDESKKKEMEGEKDIYIYAGDSKVPFAEDGSFKEEFLADLQSSVDQTYTKFVEHVAQMRGIPSETVIATQAKVYRADEAIQLGLVDKQMTTFEFADYLASLVDAEVELPSFPSHEEEDEEDEQGGCGKKKKTEIIKNGDTLADIENQAEQLADVGANAALLAELEGYKAQVAQMADLQAKAEELAALKQKAEQEAASLAAQQEAEMKETYKNVVSNLGFVEEANVDSVADALFELRGSGYEAAATMFLEQLQVARQTIENLKETMTVEQGADAAEVVVEEDEQARASKSLDAKIKELYKDQ